MRRTLIACIMTVIACNAHIFFGVDNNYKFFTPRRICGEVVEKQGALFSLRENKPVELEVRLLFTALSERPVIEQERCLYSWRIEKPTIQNPISIDHATKWLPEQNFNFTMVDLLTDLITTQNYSGNYQTLFGLQESELFSSIDVKQDVVTNEIDIDVENAMPNTRDIESIIDDALMRGIEQTMVNDKISKSNTAEMIELVEQDLPNDIVVIALQPNVEIMQEVPEISSFESIMSMSRESAEIEKILVSFQKSSIWNELGVQQIINLLDSELDIIRSLKKGNKGLVIGELVQRRNLLLQQSTPTIISIYDEVMNFATERPASENNIVEKKPEEIYLDDREKRRYFQVLENQLHTIQNKLHDVQYSMTLALRT